MEIEIEPFQQSCEIIHGKFEGEAVAELQRKHIIIYHRFSPFDDKPMNHLKDLEASLIFQFPKSCTLWHQLMVKDMIHHKMSSKVIIQLNSAKFPVESESDPAAIFDGDLTEFDHHWLENRQQWKLHHKCTISKIVWKYIFILAFFMRIAELFCRSN